MNGRAFDAQVVLTPKSSSRGKLLSQYVCARITSMDDVNLALFDFDRHNAIYYFVLNADEQIYLRYGGRDERSATQYLNLRSLELALAQGLTLHQQFLAGQLPPRPKPKPLFPQEIPLLLEHTKRSHSCVECHLIADYRAQQLEKAGELDRLSHMYCAPDITNIGLALDVPRGLVVEQGTGAAAEAGILSGDQIVSIEGTRVWTFGDLQYHYAKVSRDARTVRMGVLRHQQELQKTITLPPRWWQTDLNYRHWTVDPLVYYKSRPLSDAQKQSYGLAVDGFASVVTYIDPAVKLLKRHELQVGDIVFAVDGIETDADANTCVLHIKLRKSAGVRVRLSVVRDGERIQVPLKTERQSFRK